MRRSLERWICLALAVLGYARSPHVFAEQAPANFAFHAVGDASDLERQQVMDALAHNQTRIDQDLRTAPFVPVDVCLYASRYAYVRATGHWSASGNIEGPGKLPFLTPARNGDSAATVAVHEFTHAVTLKLLVDHASHPFDRAVFDAGSAKFPVWLRESIAVYEAGQFVHPKRMGFIGPAKYPTIDRLSGRSNNNVYRAGYTIVEFILDRYGNDGLIKLSLAYGDLSVPQAAAKAFSRDWHGYLLAQYF